MSSLQYFSENGPGKHLTETFGYAQAVILPPTQPIIKLSGQGGWDSAGNTNPTDAEGQVKLAFQNVENVLAAAGVTDGWNSVYSVRSYHVGIEKTFQAAVDTMKAKTPNHNPVWTAVAVPELALPEMLIEIEVEAVLNK
ncbi:hypothetical protein MNV49_006995 [Pseudohyphozyma bogoriensis]|nr:hypothetical protein MNV49_006995 [Pseudohyphozyma bogoriensis]